MPPRLGSPMFERLGEDTPALSLAHRDPLAVGIGARHFCRGGRGLYVTPLPAGPYREPVGGEGECRLLDRQGGPGSTSIASNSS